MKRNLATIAGLFIGLLALLLFYFWYSNRLNSENKENSSNNKKPVVLYTMENTSIKEIHVVHENLDLLLAYEGERWVSKNDRNHPIDQKKAKEMAYLMGKIVASKKVLDETVNLEQYRLDKPLVTIKATMDNDESITLSIGMKVAGEKGYYGYIDYMDGIYILDSDYGTEFLYNSIEMTELTDQPLITATNIYHVLVEKAEGDNFELLYDKRNDTDKTVSGLYPWVVLQPYEEGYSADGTKVTNTLPTFADIKFIQCVDYKGDDLSRYGLDNPDNKVTVKYYNQYTEKLDEAIVDPNTGNEITEKTITEDHTYELLVGGQDEDGNYYVKKSDGTAVYTMEAAKIDAMLAVEPFTVMMNYVFLPYIDTINKIEMEIEGKPYVMEIKRKTTTDDKGDEVTQSSYYYNGNVVEESVFKDVYQRVITASYDTKVTGDVSAEGKEPYFTVRFYMSDDYVYSTSYIPYNESFYLISEGETIRFFADKRKIDAITKVVIDFVEMDHFE